MQICAERATQSSPATTRKQHAQGAPVITRFRCSLAGKPASSCASLLRTAYYYLRVRTQSNLSTPWAQLLALLPRPLHRSARLQNQALPIDLSRFLRLRFFAFMNINTLRRKKLISCDICGKKINNRAFLRFKALRAILRLWFD